MQCGSQLSCLTVVLDPDFIRWLRSAIYRQHSSIHTVKLRRNVSDLLKPVSTHVARFRREYENVLHEIAASHPVIATQCSALLQLDPINAVNDAAVARHLAPIRAALCDRSVALAMSRDKARDVFARNFRKLWAEKGWSIRRMEKACAAAAKLLGAGARPPDLGQLLDYRGGRRYPEFRTRVILAAALGVDVASFDATTDNTKLATAPALAAQIPAPPCHVHPIWLSNERVSRRFDAPVDPF
jgi:hypothetical protein